MVSRTAIGGVCLVVFRCTAWYRCCNHVVSLFRKDCSPPYDFSSLSSLLSSPLPSSSQPPVRRFIIYLPPHAANTELRDLKQELAFNLVTQESYERKKRILYAKVQDGGKLEGVPEKVRHLVFSSGGDSESAGKEDDAGVEDQKRPQGGAGGANHCGPPLERVVEGLPPTATVDEVNDYCRDHLQMQLCPERTRVCPSSCAALVVLQDTGNPWVPPQRQPPPLRDCRQVREHRLRESVSLHNVPSTVFGDERARRRIEQIFELSNRTFAQQAVVRFYPALKIVVAVYAQSEDAARRLSEPFRIASGECLVVSPSTYTVVSVLGNTRDAERMRGAVANVATQRGFDADGVGRMTEEHAGIADCNLNAISTAFRLLCTAEIAECLVAQQGLWAIRSGGVTIRWNVYPRLFRVNVEGLPPTATAGVLVQRARAFCGDQGGGGGVVMGAWIEDGVTGGGSVLVSDSVAAAQMTGKTFTVHDKKVIFARQERWKVRVYDFRPHLGVGQNTRQAIKRAVSGPDCRVVSVYFDEGRQQATVTLAGENDYQWVLQNRNALRFEVSRVSYFAQVGAIQAEAARCDEDMYRDHPVLNAALGPRGRGQVYLSDFGQDDPISRRLWDETAWLAALQVKLRSHREKGRQAMRVCVQVSTDAFCRKQIFHPMKCYRVPPPLDPRVVDGGAPHVVALDEDIDVWEMDCLDAARKLQQTGRYAKVAVLNMASAKHAGGGYTWGTGAQEESLMRRTTLRKSLVDSPDKPVYLEDIRCDQAPCNRHRRNDMSLRERERLCTHRTFGLGENSRATLGDYGSVYSSNVRVFRGNEDVGYPLLDEPFNIDVSHCIPTPTQSCTCIRNHASDYACVPSSPNHDAWFLLA